MGERKREAWTKWKKLVSEQRGSGQSVAAFCRERGLPVSQLFAWRKRLRQAPPKPFVEVQLVGAQPRPVAGNGRAIEIRFPGGHSIFVEPGFDAIHLRAVVAALE